MGINKFIIALIMITILFLFVKKEQKEQKVTNTVKPTASFYDSTMYEITKENVRQIIKSKKANIFKNKKEELTDATIVLRSEKDHYKTNTISSKYMIKEENKVFFKDSVNLLVSNETNIKTQELYYDLRSKIARNDVAFSITQNNNTFYGENLFFNTVTKDIKAKKIKFRMKVKPNE